MASVCSLALRRSSKTLDDWLGTGWKRAGSLPRDVGWGVGGVRETGVVGRICEGRDLRGWLHEWVSTSQQLQGPGPLCTPGN